MITNAGNYTIYVSIHEAKKNMCSSPLPIGVKATIEPRSLTDSVIHLDNIDITVYYTGMPIIPENWDRGITDSNRKNEPENDQGVLDKDKDFTVSAENNTEVTNGKRDGKITFTAIIRVSLSETLTLPMRLLWHRPRYPRIVGTMRIPTGGKTAYLLRLRKMM